MTKQTVPAWAGSAETMARRVKPILHMITVGKAVTPTEISELVRPEGSTKDYSAKYITFLRLLGFDFSVTKQGRKIVSYVTIKEPANANDIRSVSAKTKKVQTTKAPAPNSAKAASPKKAATPKKETVKAEPKPKKVAAAKKAPVARGGNAANLAKLKAVGARFKKVATKFDEVEDTFGTTGELGAIDGGWDSIEGLDLSKLL